MADGNPLVAQAKPNEYGAGAGINLAEDATDTFNGIKDGDWVSGGLGMLSLAGDLASAAAAYNFVNPRNWWLGQNAH